MKTLTEALKEGQTTAENALAIFDQLETVDVNFMIGKWKGSEVQTSHPLGGGLESTGWYGKIFKDPENVSPLVFYTLDKSDVFFVNPIVMAKNTENQGKSGPILMGELQEQVETTDYKARLRMTEYRGKVSATMIYDDMPINDVFRKVDEATVLGVMDSKGVPEPLFFILKRDN